MNIKKQIFRKRKRGGKIRYMILRASLHNWAYNIGDFAMAMMGNGSVMGGRDGYGGLSGI